jgi:hypothetical protein
MKGSSAPLALAEHPGSGTGARRTNFGAAGVSSLTEKLGRVTRT